MADEQQLELPGASAAPKRPALADALRERVRHWREDGVLFGTSSWKYEGWLGQVYTAERYRTRGQFSKPRFERDCLSEYAETFPTVCGDFSFYAFYSPEFWNKLFSQVPDDFQFGFKAPEVITAPHFADLERFGHKRGERNSDFMNVALLKGEFLDRLASHQQQVGYVVFEFPQFRNASADDNAAFLRKLDAFLGQLPEKFRYAVEVRTRSLLCGEYFACLRKHRVAHVFNFWTRMPTIGDQLQLAEVFTTDFVVARVLLRPGRAYEEAVRMFQPYDQVRDPYPEGVRDVADLVRKAQQRQPKAKTFVAINNRFVGNAPLVIGEILDNLGSSHPPPATSET